MSDPCPTLEPTRGGTIMKAALAGTAIAEADAEAVPTDPRNEVGA